MSSLGLPSDLPHEVIAVLPADPFAQLDLSHRIANYALSQKISALENEGHLLKETVIQKQNHIKSLERKVSNLELELQDTQIKNKQAVEDNHRLQNERTALIDLVKKLNKEVSKLESFKKNLYQQLQEDAETVAHIEASSAAVELSSERLLSETLGSVGRPAAIGSAPYAKISTPLMGNSGRIGGGSSLGYDAPPPPPPPQQSQSQQPLSLSQHGAGGAGISTGMGLGAGSGAGSPRIDGREFFRLARSRLSYEQFSQFLLGIKELNAGKLSRDDALRRARDIFGVTNADLYGMFETLLSRHSSPY